MRVWSVSTFMSELDILEIRLAELDPVVDVFVLCEARQTHMGKERHLVYPYHRTRFLRWAHKIRYIAIDFPADVKAPWARENYQREQLGIGLEGLRPEDIIIISDVDEILRAGVVSEIKRGLFPIPSTLSFPIHPYQLDWKWDVLEDGFCRCTLINGAHLKRGRGGYGGIQHRLLENNTQPGIVGEFGWHFTYIGDAASIVEKSRSIADTWVKGKTTLEMAEHALLTGEDAFGREDRRASRVPLSHLPACVERNPARYAHILGCMQD